VFSFLILSLRAPAGEISKTTFDDWPSGALENFKNGWLTGKAQGDVQILEHKNSVGKYLRISSNNNGLAELIFNKNKPAVKGISFQAHCDGKSFKSPQLSVWAQVDEQWQELIRLEDTELAWSQFASKVTLAIPKGASAIRFSVKANKQISLFIDNLVLLDTSPKQVTKSLNVAKAPIKNYLQKHDLFVSGTHKTHTFRIPALVTAMNGDLIAISDARRENSWDLHGARDIDIVLRRSTDNGKTWTDLETLCDHGYKHPASDASLIVDRKTGEIFCFYNYMDQTKRKREFRNMVQSSKDHGKTWGKARDITDQIAGPGFGKHDKKFITSGRGLQLENGDLMLAYVNNKRGLSLIRSQDHGKTWSNAYASIGAGDESKLVELVDGTLMINCRGALNRPVHTLAPGSTKWQTTALKRPVDPLCNASIIRYTSVKDGYAKNRLLFSNANSPRSRKNVSIFISYDEGKTWSEGKVIDANPSAYSSLTICADGSIGMLYEYGDKETRKLDQGMRFVKFTLEELTDGKDKLEKPYKLK